MSEDLPCPLNYLSFFLSTYLDVAPFLSPLNHAYHLMDTIFEHSVMDIGPPHMPSKVLTAAIPVLIYSFICLSLGLLLITVLYRTTEGVSYVLLFAIATTLTTVISIIQQSNYIANWHLLRIQQFEQSVIAKGNPALALGPLSRGFNAILFWIILYFYNVDSVIMSFWSVALVFNVWNIQPSLIQHHGKCIGTTSKIMALVIPAIFSGLREGFQVNAGYAGTIVLMNIVMIVSLAAGAICIVLILVKYLSTRMKFRSNNNGARSSNSGMEMPRRPGNLKRLSVLSATKSGVDSWLVLRFTIAFLILCAFEIFLVFFEINRYQKIKHNEVVEKPDFSDHASISDIINYIPGVTASLLAFLLFGTTTQHRAMYSALNPLKNRLNRGSRTDPERFSGTLEEWGRMESESSRSSQRRPHDFELLPRAHVHYSVPLQTFVTHDGPLESKRSSIRRILGRPPHIGEIGILDDCESIISSPSRTIQGVPSTQPTGESSLERSTED